MRRREEVTASPPHGADCAACPFARNGCPYRPVLGEFPRRGVRPLGVLVGESPGKEDSERGRPFAGLTGQALDDELGALGLPRSKLVLVNAICCVPPFLKSEQMMSKAIRACAPALKAQLRQAYELGGNMHVFAMGKWAATALMGVAKGVMNTRGFIRDDWTLEKFVK